ncbi:MAG: hypothetical protein KGM17_11915 [Sphingomonadales bacterium]|nr:hypothetical protein [Sphingomonadales bacterium]
MGVRPAGLALAAALLASGQPASAREDGAALGAQLRATQVQLQALQARLDALQAQLDARDRARQAAAANVQAAATLADDNATAALAAARAAQAGAARAENMLGRLHWAGDTTIGGRIFADASTISQHTAGAVNTATGTGVNLKRIYVEVNHRFDATWSASLVADASNVAGSTTTGNGFVVGATPVGKGLFVKNAYVQARLSPALVLRLGAAPLPWVPYIENQVGTRYVDTMLIDRVNDGTTADWGIHASGDLFDGHVSYAVSLVDGAGYRNLRVTRAIDVEGRVSLRQGGLWGAVGGYLGKRGAAVAGTPTFRTARRIDAAAGYRDARFGLGAEVFYAKDWNNVAVDPAAAARSRDAALGWSLFGNVAIAPRWSAFARHDHVAPSRINLPAMRDRYVNLGVQWEPARAVDLALVWKHETVSGGALATQNGTIGCAITATPVFFAAATPTTCAGNGTYSEFGLFTQVKF